MKILLFSLLLFANVAIGATFNIGNGVSGAVSLTSMTGHSAGDVAVILTPSSGSYTALTLTNLNGITVVSQDVSNPVTFTTTSTISNNKFLDISYVNFTWASGSGIAWNLSGGNVNNTVFHHIKFYGWGSSVISDHNNIQYDYSDTATLMQYKNTYHDIVIDSCGQFMQGSFGDPNSGGTTAPDVWRLLTFYNIQDMATSLQGGNGQGTGVRGICYECEAHDVYITDRSGRGADGDVGYFYGSGAWHLYRCYKWGGPGYLVRLNGPMSEQARPFDNWVINCGKFGGTQYGFANYQFNPNDTITAKTYGPSTYAFNNTFGNQFNDTLGYWSTMYNFGQIGIASTVNPTPHYYAKNSLAFNIGNNIQKVSAGGQPNNAKAQIAVNLGSWTTIGGDTSNNQYYHDATAAKLDSTTVLYTNRIGTFPIYAPTSASPSTILGDGTTVPIYSTVTDFNGYSLKTPPDVGYIQYYAPVMPTISVFTTQTPPSAAITDAAVTLGMKFSSSSNGYVSAVKFYKKSGMSGVHTGMLYSSGGTLLSSIVFTGETATGWQTMQFSSPVSIAAGLTYIIAVHMANGIYVVDNNGFNGAISNTPLSAPADGTTPNGVYTYGSSPAFPTSNYQQSNYFLDINFTYVGANANAGADQQITLPTNSTTLNGSGSVGTITSYLWTNVSGPNTASISTPTTVTTNVTGLIAGTYVFQLAVNTTATDLVTVVVNPLSSFNFTTISKTGNDILPMPGRGAEDWYNSNGVPMPTRTSPDSSVDTYWRFTWEDVQDYATGAMKWTYFDAKVQFAASNGKKFNFGIYAFNPSYGPNVGGSTLNYPLVVHNAMQAETTYKDNRGTGASYPDYNSWIPNWNAPSFKLYWNRLQDSIIYHLKHTTYSGKNGYDIIGYVDIRAYGNTGEWTGYNTGNKPSYIPTNAIVTSATQIQYVDSMISKWPDKQLSICIGAVLGTTVSDATLTPDVGYYIFGASNSFGRIGLRRDCLGQTDAFVHTLLENNSTVYNGFRFDSAIMNRYKVAPFYGEPCSCCMIAGDPLNQGISYWDLPRQISFYHHTGFGNGNLYLPGTSAQILQEGDSVRQASKNSGYRLILTGGSIAAVIAPSAVFNLTVNWQNVGISPVYENWDVVYELRSGASVVGTWTSAFHPRLFLPGAASAKSDAFTLGAVAPGTYSLYMIIKDPTGYRSPLPLAITGRQSDGAYLISNTVVVGTSPCVNCNQFPGFKYSRKIN